MHLLSLLCLDFDDDDMPNTMILSGGERLI